MDTSKNQDPSEDSSERVSTPKGFGLGVNNYLNHYVTVADAKSVAILTGTFAILAAMMDFKVPNNSCLILFGVGLTYVLTLITIAGTFRQIPGNTLAMKVLENSANILNYRVFNRYL